MASSSLDLTPLKDAVSSRSYDKIADICDELRLQVASQGISYVDEWPYAIHLMGYMLVQDMNSARFLWKCIPNSAKESQPELVAVWAIGQRLWTRDYAGVYEALHGFDWSPEIQALVSTLTERYRNKIFQLLLNAYSTISVADTARFLGLSEEDATKYGLKHGWTIDPALQMLTVTKMPVVSEQKLDPGKLQSLTEYVFHLEH
ncbi:unnamed protein product [Victoria cruziana]